LFQQGEQSPRRKPVAPQRSGPLLEGCSATGCVAPRANVQKNVGDWILTGMIFTDRGYDNGSFKSAPDGTLVQTP